MTLAAVTDSRVYNGTTSSTGVVTTTGLQTGDTLIGLSQSYASKDVLGANLSTLNVNAGYTLNDGNGGLNYIVTLNIAAGTITPAALTVAANPQSKLFGQSDPVLTYSVAGLVNNPALGIADTADSVFSGALTRVPGESAIDGPYAITQGSLAADSNYTLSSFSGNHLTIIGAAEEPVLGFNAGQVIFAGVINNEFYYRPGNFWHISLNPNNADPGFDVMRGTNNLNSRLSRNLNRCDSVSGGGFCETWAFPQQRE
jgi:hypothetical protein